LQYGRVISSKELPSHPPLKLVFPAIFAAVLLAHLSLLRLPYYWDEAGYYIPAAYDFFRTGSVIPFSTLSNAHPPLPSIYLSAWWKVFGFAPWVTRLAMCAVSSIALLAVYRLAILTTTRHKVAMAVVVLTGLYPVWFAQSSLAHADMFAAAATLWALVFFFEERLWIVALCFSLAALSKETAIVTPLALAVWELWLLLAPEKWKPSASSGRAHLLKTAILLLPMVPLACWYLYHWHRTGFVFGNPEYLRYNATATLTPFRVLLAFAHRVLHMTAHMNLFVPVLSMLACMMLPPIEGRERISISDQMQFYVIILANLIFFSILGGALLTRYLLPLYPLVILVCVNTFYRRLRQWTYLVLLSAVAFVAGIFINPPYRFAPEDNLAYRDVILLHQAAIGQMEAHYPGAIVLTAWPATDELSKPELGYVTSPMQVISIDNFALPQIEKAAQMGDPYSVALIFSTKYNPPHMPLSLGGKNEALDTRFFDFHRDLPPEMIARLLGGKVVWRAERQGQWTAMIHFDRPQEAMETKHDLPPLNYNHP
jgi:4-amino-4-deoxy-L-arabinose transferase-like glycosyltransferase